MFELDCTLDPFHVFARPRTRRSGPLGLATSTAGARSFLGACCEREKREGIAIGGELCRPWDSGRSYVKNVDAGVRGEVEGRWEGYRSVCRMVRARPSAHGRRVLGYRVPRCEAECILSECARRPRNRCPEKVLC